MPPRATTAVRVRGAAQSPVAAEAAPTSRPARPRHAHFCVTLCHGSMVTPLASILGTCSTPKPHTVCACPASTARPCAGASVPAAANAAPCRPPTCSSPGSPFLKRSSKRFSLLKTAQCWQVLHTTMEKDEEEIYDENKR